MFIKRYQGHTNMKIDLVEVTINLYHVNTNLHVGPNILTVVIW